MSIWQESAQKMVRQELCPKPSISANTAGDLKETMDYYANKCAEYRAERDALKARERELVEALRIAVKYVPESTFYGGQEAFRPHPDGEKVRAVLAKMR